MHTDNFMNSNDKKKQMDTSMQNKNEKVKKGSVRVEMHTDNFMKSDDMKKQMDASMLNKNEKIKVNMDKSIVVSETSFVREEKCIDTLINRDINQGNINSSISRIAIDIS